MNIDTTEIQYDDSPDEFNEQPSIVESLDKPNNKSYIRLSDDTSSQLNAVERKLHSTIPESIEWLLNNRTIKMRAEYAKKPYRNIKTKLSEENKAKLWEIKDFYKLSSFDEVIWRLMNDYLFD